MNLIVSAGFFFDMDTDVWYNQINTFLNYIWSDRIGAVMNIYLLRHGETDWNKEGRLQGHTDIMLNQKGRKQIGRSAEILAKLPVDFDLIISSPLLRARESAEITADRLAYPKENIVMEPLLVERSFGEAEGFMVTELGKKYSFDQSLFPLYQYPGAEPMEELFNRAYSVFDKIVNIYGDKKNILVAAHGAILYAILTAVTDGKIAYFGKTTRFDPGSLHLIRYQNGVIDLSRYCTEESSFKDILY